MNNSNKIEYKIRKSVRAKRMRIAVYCDGSVIVTIPRNFKGNIDNIIIQKKNWILEKIEEFLKSPLKFLKVDSKRDFEKYRNEILNIIEKRIEFFNKFYNFKYNKINIKNQKTRWGSCSRKGNLNFNYKLLFLPSDVRDYVIVHELCHLKEFNHSKKFWNLISIALPNYKSLRNGLKIK